MDANIHHFNLNFTLYGAINMNIVNNLLDYSTPWSLPDVYLFTGNPIRRKDGAIVMGRGAALAVKSAYPQIQYGFQGNKPLRWETITDKQHIGWFQVKEHWAHPAQIELVEQATLALEKVAYNRPNINFHINYPAVGNGQLTESQVAPILDLLPDNVYVYR